MSAGAKFSAHSQTRQSLSQESVSMVRLSSLNRRITKMLTTTSLILTVLDVLRYVAILIQTRSGIMSSTTM